MTTMKLIERGVGHNCLADAYDLGRADQKAEDEKIIEDLKYCNAHIPNIEQIRADAVKEFVNDYMSDENVAEFSCEKCDREIDGDFCCIECFRDRWLKVKC